LQKTDIYIPDESSVVVTIFLLQVNVHYTSQCSYTEVIAMPTCRWQGRRSVEVN